MNPQTIGQEVKALIVSELRLRDVRPEDIADADPLFNGEGGAGSSGLGLDSLDALTLALALESKFNVEIPDEAMGPEVFRSVNTLVSYILAHSATS